MGVVQSLRITDDQRFLCVCEMQGKFVLMPQTTHLAKYLLLLILNYSFCDFLNLC